jgi:hypothetical protein
MLFYYKGKDVLPTDALNCMHTIKKYIIIDRHTASGNIKVLKNSQNVVFVDVTNKTGS